MKQFKKILRLTGVILMIVLACFGAGLAGALPVRMNNKRETMIELRVELKEANEIEGELLEFKSQE